MHSPPPIGQDAHICPVTPGTALKITGKIPQGQNENTTHAPHKDTQQRPTSGPHNSVAQICAGVAQIRAENCRKSPEFAPLDGWGYRLQSNCARWTACTPARSSSWVRHE